MPKRVGVNGRGYRVGATHHRAKLSDEEVELLLALLQADEFGPGLSYREAAIKMGVSKSTVRDYAKGRIRAQHPERWRVVKGRGRA